MEPYTSLMLERIDHINLVVRDMETMTQFYTRVLGLTVTKRADISGPWVSRVVGLDDVEARVVYLDPPHGPRLELIQYVRPVGEQPEGLAAANTRGFRHLAFHVNHMDDTVVGLRQAGIKLLSDIQHVPESQVTYADGVRKRLVYFHDPEGNLLELCEYR